MLRDNLRLQRRRRGFCQLFLVSEVDRDRERLHRLQRDLSGAREAVRDHGRVHAALEELEAGREQRSADDLGLFRFECFLMVSVVVVVVVVILT